MAVIELYMAVIELYGQFPYIFKILYIFKSQCLQMSTQFYVYTPFLGSIVDICRHNKIGIIYTVDTMYTVQV